MKENKIKIEHLKRWKILNKKLKKKIIEKEIQKFVDEEVADVCFDYNLFMEEGIEKLKQKYPSLGFDVCSGNVKVFKVNN